MQEYLMGLYKDTHFWSVIGAMGSWVGGIGSAIAGGIAISVANDSRKYRIKQQKVFLAGNLPRLFPQWAAVIQDAFILKNNPEYLFLAKKDDENFHGINISFIIGFSEQATDISEALAGELGEFISRVETLNKFLLRQKKSGGKEFNKSNIKYNASLVFDSAKRLGKILEKESPSSKEMIRTVISLFEWTDKNAKRTSPSSPDA